MNLFTGKVFGDDDDSSLTYPATSYAAALVAMPHRTRNGLG
jgi:hypothetical protein